MNHHDLLGIFLIFLMVNGIISAIISNWARFLKLETISVSLISFFLSPIIALLYIIIFKDVEDKKIVDEKDDNRGGIIFSIFIFICVLFIFISFSR